MEKINFDTNIFDVFEGMTSISAVISSIENKSSDRRIVLILYNTEKKRSKYNELRYLSSKSEILGFELRGVSHSEIDEIANGKTHGGIIAICTKTSPAVLTAPDQIIDDGFYILLDGVEDPFNFAYALRSVYAAGADGVIVPSYRFNNSQGLVCKGSAGTSELISIFESDITNAVDIFRSKGYKIACAGIRDSVSLYDADLKKPLLLIVGGEKRGISGAVLDSADSIVRIDYGRTFRGSLTASSAATILAFEVFRQNKNTDS